MTNFYSLDFLNLVPLTDDYCDDRKCLQNEERLETDKEKMSFEDDIYKNSKCKKFFTMYLAFEGFISNDEEAKKTTANSTRDSICNQIPNANVISQTNNLKESIIDKPDGEFLKQKLWTRSEDQMLIKLSHSQLRNKWLKISKIIGTKTQSQCSYRYKKLIERNQIPENVEGDILLDDDCLSKKFTLMSKYANSKSSHTFLKRKRLYKIPNDESDSSFSMKRKKEKTEVDIIKPCINVDNSKFDFDEVLSLIEADSIGRLQERQYSMLPLIFEEKREVTSNEGAQLANICQNKETSDLYNIEAEYKDNDASVREFNIEFQRVFRQVMRDNQNLSEICQLNNNEILTSVEKYLQQDLNLFSYDVYIVFANYLYELNSISTSPYSEKSQVQKALKLLIVIISRMIQFAERSLNDSRNRASY